MNAAESGTRGHVTDLTAYQAAGPARPDEAASAWSGAIRSAELMHGRSVLHIEHNGALYQLRATRLGKLILTK